MPAAEWASHGLKSPTAFLPQRHDELIITSRQPFLDAVLARGMVRTTAKPPGGFTPASPLTISNTLGVLTDPRAFAPGAPFAAYAGLKARF
jgi:hypothetical protein